MLALVISLIIIGLVLLAIELLIIPRFGVTGILGIASLVGACFFAFYSFGYLFGVLITAGILLLIVLSIIVILRSGTWKKLSLRTNIEAKVDNTPESKGFKIGDSGITITRLAPGGHVKFGEHIVEVSTRDGLIEPNKEVVISSFEGTRIFVSIVK